MDRDDIPGPGDLPLDDLLDDPRGPDPIEEPEPVEPVEPIEPPEWTDPSSYLPDDPATGPDGPGPGGDDDGPPDRPDELPEQPDGRGDAPGGSTPPSAPPVSDPIVLDVDEPLEPELDRAGDAALDDGAEGPDQDRDGDSDGDGADDGAIELPIDGDLDSGDYDVAPDNGTLGDAVLAAGLSSIGVAAVIPAVRHLGRQSAPGTAALLDSLGVDARVEHGDLLRLHEHLRAGDHVLLSTDGSAGVDAERVLQVRQIDRTTDRVELSDSDGNAQLMTVTRLEEVWADTANQLVVASGDEVRAVLLPVSVNADDLRAP